MCLCGRISNFLNILIKHGEYYVEFYYYRFPIIINYVNYYYFLICIPFILILVAFFIANYSNHHSTIISKQHHSEINNKLTVRVTSFSQAHCQNILRYISMTSGEEPKIEVLHNNQDCEFYFYTKAYFLYLFFF